MPAAAAAVAHVFAAYAAVHPEVVAGAAGFRSLPLHQAGVDSYIAAGHGRQWLVGRPCGVTRATLFLLMLEAVRLREVRPNTARNKRRSICIRALALLSANALFRWSLRTQLPSAGLVPILSGATKIATLVQSVAIGRSHVRLQGLESRLARLTKPVRRKFVPAAPPPPSKGRGALRGGARGVSALSGRARGLAGGPPSGLSPSGASEMFTRRRRMRLPALNFVRGRLVKKQSPPKLSSDAERGLRSKKRILILISDTGGGHRASAQALAGVIEQLHGDHIETVIVDVWTTYGPWPYNRMVRQYRFMASYPALWYTAYKSSSFAPTRFLLNRMMSVSSFRGVRDCIYEYSPDLVVSMHPLCQTVPLQVLRSLSRKDASATNSVAAAARGSESTPRRVPFATVVTDLGSPHPLWLHPGVDLCFVPSQVFVRAALRRGLRSGQLRRHGLPVRPSFTQQQRRGAEARRALGLLPERQTVLIVGGGDGVGKLEAIVKAVGNTLGKRDTTSQLVVVCGKNQKLRERLQSTKWPPGVHVVVEGFVSRMSEYMAAADCIITKAGPGTIAEASICGLPVMLSGHLPGQESGNVKYVIQNGFGAYSKKPHVIARIVAGWLSNPEKLKAMSERARRASRPDASYKIVDDLVGLLARHDGSNPFDGARSQAPSHLEVAMAAAPAAFMATGM